MTRTEFLAYLDAYNSGDESRLAQYYDSDIIFENFGGYHRGAEVKAFIGFLNTVVRSRMTMLNLLIDGDLIALEADTELVALRDLPDLPIGALKEGERKIARTFAFYETDGAIIKHVRIAGWPPRTPD